MNYMIFDVETTTRNKGSPYTQGNRLCWVGYKYRWAPTICVNLDIDSDLLLPTKLHEHTVVGVNLKFDLEWYRKYTGVVPEKIFDLQIAFFILRNQKHPFPSLNEMAEFYGLGKKLDVVAEEYWEKGIDTPDIPDEVMREYLSRDLELTEQVFLKILEEIDSRKDPNLMRLIQIHNMDLLVLMSMQSNGIRYNKEKAENYKNILDGEIQGVLQELGSYCPGVPVNFDSGDHLSRLLFGGTISVPERVAVGNYKTGAKIGQLRYRIEHKEYELPGFVKPKKEWALKKEGFYATREAVLRQINKPVARLLLQYAELVKLKEYFVKLPQLIEEKGWENDTLHGNFNQQVAVTGRLSSSDPNLQNMPPEVCQMLEPHNGLFVGVDAKALEWVAVVYLSQDPVGMREIIDGVDQHSVNQKAFGLPSRHIAKIFVFRLIYGGSEYSYSKDPDFSEVSKDPKFWKEVIDKFYDKYRGIRDLHQRWMSDVQVAGGHTMCTGRSYEHKPDPVRFEWPRTQIINYPVQGLGADIMAICRVLAHRFLKRSGIEGWLSSTIHDSLYIDCRPEDKDIAIKVFTDAFKETPIAFKKAFGVEFNLPLRCECSVGPNLGDMEEVK